jgi:CBS domain-containing protein
LASSQTDVFRHLVRDHMQAPPVVVGAGTAVERVVAGMAERSTSAAVVVDGGGRIQGILTEQDVVRRIACRHIGERPVETCMTQPVLTVRASDYLYTAIGFMRRHRLRHMPVVDAEGALVGMLYLHDALALAAGARVDDIDRLTHETSLEGLLQIKAAQVQLAADLFADNVPAPEIQSLISDINNDIHRRVVALSLRAMAEDGWGEPPVGLDVIVMGSGGRGESFLFPDQDNGFILEDYPDDRHTSIDAFFIELALRTVGALDRVGFPLCRGAVMATNPLWRKTLSQWRAQLRFWMRRQSDVMLQLCDIFFDFGSVYGEPRLADELRLHVTRLARANPGFLRAMYGVQAEHRAGIGMFNRLLTEREDPEHKGELNVKYSGTLPLAEAVRLLALRSGIAATSTLARIGALAEAGLLGADRADHLAGAYGLVTSIQLRQQIADFRAGRRPSNFVDPAVLSRRETALLKDSLKAINDFRGQVRSDLTGEL